jgi:hypothetical protein
MEMDVQSRRYSAYAAVLVCSQQQQQPFYADKQMSGAGVGEERRHHWASYIARCLPPTVTPASSQHRSGRSSCLLLC